MARDAAKTVSFLALHFVVGFSITYALTSSVSLSV